MGDVRKVHLQEAFVAGKRLGRHIEHDERSRAFEIEARGTTKLRSVHWRRHGQPFDQGELGSCTGNAIAGALNTEPIYPAGKHQLLLHEKDAVDLYALATRLDEFPGDYPPDDTGSSGLAACKAAKTKGLISSYRHAFGIHQALTALMHGPVITGVNWYEGFDQPDANGHVTVNGQVRGGHEFEVLGYDVDAGEVLAENSWGAGWGIRGRFTFDVATWARLLDEQGDVTVPRR
jgi:hypothetical protein